MGSSGGNISTVLVVEDNDDTRIVIRLELEKYGYLVVEARNGREAIELALRACPDLILMDLNLPKVDGLTAAQAIRQLGEKCGAILRKPIDFPNLEKTVSGFLYG